MTGPKVVAIGDCVRPAETWNPLKATGDSEFSYIDLSAVDQERKEISEARIIACAEAPSRARQLVEEGDVLVSTVRPNLNGVARVGASHHGATASTGFCVLRPVVGKLDSGYAFQWVKSPSFVADMVSKATGASYPAVSERIILESRIPLPPFPAQRRIAAILDQADALRAKRREALAQLDSLTQSIFIEMFGDPVSNPLGWKQVTLSDVLLSIDSGWSPICLDRPVADGEWGVLKLGAVTSCTYDPAANKALPASSAPDPSIEVKTGDLLFSRKNTYDLVAACAYVGTTIPRLMMSDLIFRLQVRATAKLDKRYLHALLTNGKKRHEVQKLAGGSSGSMPNISKSRLLGFLIEMPPLQLQQTFATRTQAIESLKATHRAALAESDALFASLQHRAFAGQLS